MFFLLFSINFFAEYQEPLLRWQPIRFQTLYKAKDYGAKSFHNPSIQYLWHDNSVLLVNDISYSSEDAPANVGIVARKGYINYRTNGSSNIDWLNPVLITDPVSKSGDYNPACVVDQKTGKIICIWNGDKSYEDSTAEDPAHIYFSTSTDDGFTWEPKQDITSKLYSSLCPSCTAEQQKWKAMNISSGSGVQLREGRIIFPVVVRYNFPYGPTKNFFIISDDFGLTWTCTTDGPITNCVQAKVLEQNSGNVLSVIGQNGTTKMVSSSNGGLNWKMFGNFGGIQNGNSNVGLKRFTSTLDGYNRNRILLSMPNNNQGKFNNLAIFISYDEGSTWQYSNVIEWGESAYSSIATTPNGDILVFYEKGGETPYDLVVANFSVDFLTNGADTYQKPDKFRWCLSTQGESAEKCPIDANYMSYNAIDNYIESYPIYAEDFQISFVDSFRDFTIDLSKEGMKTGNISNYNEKRISINFVGSATQKRSLTIKGNIDLFISKKNSEFVEFINDDKVNLNIVDSKNGALLLNGNGKVARNRENVNTISTNVTILISSLLFVAGLLIVFVIDRVYLKMKGQKNDASSFL